jgi:hypothetical protein
LRLQWFKSFPIHNERFPYMRSFQTPFLKNPHIHLNPHE